MIYLLPLALILLFDIAATYYSAKTVKRIQQSSKENIGIRTVLFQSIYLLGVRMVSRFFSIDRTKLATYKRNQPLISQVVVAEFMIVAVIIGFSIAARQFFNDRDAYLSGRENDTIVWMIVVSALAAGCAAFLYTNAKSFIDRYKSQFLLHFDNIEVTHAGMSFDVLGEVGRASPKKERKEALRSPDPIPMYFCLEFVDDNRAKEAIRLYRTERHGEYQYFGVPNPRTVVVHRRDVSGLVEHLDDHKLFPGTDFSILPVLLTGQVPAKERQEVFRRARSSFPRIDAPELERRVEDAERKLKELKLK